MDIDLTPTSGKHYFNVNREWREEFIYFLMVDRFHDHTSRNPVLSPSRSKGVKTPDNFYGGKIKGITQNLEALCEIEWVIEF
jgi:alpha-amylase